MNVPTCEVEFAMTVTFAIGVIAEGAHSSEWTIAVAFVDHVPHVSTDIGPPVASVRPPAPQRYVL